MEVIKVVGTTLVAGGVTYLAAPVILPVVGFTQAGVVAGSLAASAQSAFYGGATAGVFSALQAAGAGGVAGSIIPGVSAISAGAFLSSSQACNAVKDTAMPWVYGAAEQIHRSSLGVVDSSQFASVRNLVFGWSEKVPEDIRGDIVL